MSDLPDPVTPNASQPSMLAATLDISGSGSLAEALPAGKGKRELVVGDQPLSDETQDLLRKRLQIAAGLLLAGFCAYLVRSLLIQRPPFLNVMHLGVIIMLGGVVSLLFLRPEIGTRSLRWLEAVTFYAPMAFLSVNQYVIVHHSATAGDEITALAAMKSTVLYVFGLMITYGTFIPNRWYRALWFVLPMACAPVVVAISLRVYSPSIRVISEQVAAAHQVSDNILMLVLGLLASVVSTHVINTLRVEAFAARHLAQYRLTRPLGQGGMGEVYLAEHELLKRPCAVKLIRPSKAGDPKALARFAREVKHAARLSHWNSIDIFDYGVTKDGTFFYVMEYLPGLTLEQIVSEHGPMPASRAIYLISQICDALSEADQHGLVHRDIKPSNIFAAHRGGLYDVAKLLDYGLVRPLDTSDGQLSVDGDITGSPLFMSPEQAGGVVPDIRSDLYAVGCVLFYLVTGRPPFIGDNVLQVMLAHIREPAPDPRDLGFELPDDLVRIMLRCLEKNPDSRFASPSALKEALDACEDAGDWDRQLAARWWETSGVKLRAEVRT